MLPVLKISWLNFGVNRFAFYDDVSDAVSQTEFHNVLLNTW